MGYLRIDTVMKVIAIALMVEFSIQARVHSVYSRMAYQWQEQETVQYVKDVGKWAE